MIERKYMAVLGMSLFAAKHEHLLEDSDFTL